MRCLRRILGLSWKDRLPNSVILKKSKDTEHLRHLRWLGHVRRMEDGRIPKDVLYGQLTSGSRGVGRQALRYKDICKRDMKSCGISTDTWEAQAEDRAAWCRVVQSCAEVLQMQTREEEKLQQRNGDWKSYLTGGEDYWTHRRPNLFAKDPNAFHGLDLRDQDKPVLDQNGTYSTNLFASKAIEVIRNHPQNKPMFLYLPFQAVHSPLEAPREYIDMYNNVENTLVRTYAAMVTAMDEAVGNVTDALRKTGLWNDTVLIFSTDNGARRNAGSNWPLRGWKSTLWEGGVRGVGFVTSKLLKKAKRRSDALIHISDWFPTLLRISRASTKNTKSLDGFDVWDAISMGSPSPRKEILHNIDPLHRRSKSSSSHLWSDDIFDTSTYAAIRSGNWKLLTGYQDLGGWKHRGTSGNHFEEPEDSHDKHLWLFNIRDDPHERTDLSEKGINLKDGSSARRSGVITAKLERNHVIRQLAASIPNETSMSPFIWCRWGRRKPKCVGLRFATCYPP
ncbi:hypothetical protein Bbelb_021840 [Branchiostoma belcheri]|nr:hypothetical protein Bbelb_021840 [Branchiostoma belcheri]